MYFVLAYYTLLLFVIINHFSFKEVGCQPVVSLEFSFRPALCLRPALCNAPVPRWRPRARHEEPNPPRAQTPPRFWREKVLPRYQGNPGAHPHSHEGFDSQHQAALHQFRQGGFRWGRWRGRSSQVHPCTCTVS